MFVLIIVHHPSEIGETKYGHSPCTQYKNSFIHQENFMRPISKSNVTTSNNHRYSQYFFPQFFQDHFILQTKF